MPLVRYKGIQIQFEYNKHINRYTVKFNILTNIHTSSHFGADTVSFVLYTFTRLARTSHPLLIPLDKYVYKQ